MLSVKLLDDYLIKSQDIKTFKIQLLRDSLPYAIASDCTCTLLVATKDAIAINEEIEIVDATQGIVQFTLHATIGTGSFDCEFTVSNDNGTHLTFPDNGFTVLKISDCLAERPVQVVTAGEYEKLNERMDGFIGELDTFEQSVTTTIDGFEVTLTTMQTQINDSINTMNSNFETLENGIEQQMSEMEELVSTVANPMTLTLENDNNNFSVGVDNIGTKYNVIESSENTIELNGRTLVNLWGNKQSDFYISENVILNNDGTLTAKAKIGGGWQCCSSYRGELFKPSTEYTIITEVLENTLNGSFYIINVSGDESVFHNAKAHVFLDEGFTGISVNKLVSKDMFSVSKMVGLRSFIGTECNDGSITYRCIILEGDYTNVPIEYFEGLKSAKPVETKSVGKNLFNINNHLDSLNIKNGYIETIKVKNQSSEVKYQLKPNTNYIMTFCKYGSESCWVNVEINGVDGNNSNTNFTRKFTTDENGEIYIKIGANSGNDIGHKIYNIQLEEGTTATEYESYKENIVTLPNIEPLRSLPNGICDEAFIHDDKLVVTRKCNEVTFNGNEDWVKWQEKNNTISFSLRNWYSLEPSNGTYQDNSKGKKAICNCFKFELVETLDTPYFMYHHVTQNDNMWIGFNIEKSKLSSNDVDGWKEWLSSNDVSVVYKLATPTHEWYELPTPHLYKDGHAFIESGSVPLTTNTHNVNLSLRSAIDTNTEEIRQIKTELKNLKTIKNFGAVGDGVTDDTEAILNAANSGEAIFFPKGTYLLHKPINVSTDISWQGEGEGTIIKLMPTYKDNPEEYDGKTIYNCDMIKHLRSDGASYSISLTDLTLDANKEAFENDIFSNGASKYDHTTCLDIHKPKSVYLNNVTCKGALIEGCYIYNIEGTPVTISNCDFSNNGYYQKDGSGLHIEGYNPSTVVTNCKFNENGFHGLLLGGTDGVTVSNITANSNGFDGICLWGGASNNIISNVHSNGNRGGIHLKGAYSSYIKDAETGTFANGNIINNLHTDYNVYGVMFGNSTNTIINGWYAHQDSYNYCICHSNDITTNVTGVVSNNFSNPTDGDSHIEDGDNTKFKVNFTTDIINQLITRIEALENN